MKPSVPLVVAGVCLLSAAAYPSSVPVFSCFELTITAKAFSGNPFDPSQNDIQMVVTDPKGQTTSIPAFYDGDNTWRVRFTPQKPGTYRYRILARGNIELDGTPTAGSFRAAASKNHGFVRINPSLRTRFAFSTGEPFFPVGHNVAWPSRWQSQFVDYDAFFPKMGAAGENWARVWMTAWGGLNIEWTPGRLGSYNLEAARYLDRILALAEKHGIFIQLVIQHHGQFSTRVNPNWNENPMNEALGGFLSRPGEFFTNARAKELFKRKARYIVSRWGYSTHIFAWELFNEVQYTDHPGWDAVVRWHSEMASYIRSIDPYKHLITTSSPDPSSPVWDSMDFYQEHFYNNDPAAAASGDLNPSRFTKPYFVGEWGATNGAGPTENGAEFLRRGLWSGIMTGASAAPMFWDWNYIHRHDLYKQIGVTAKIVNAAGLAGRGDLRQTKPRVNCQDLGPLVVAPQQDWGAVQRFEFRITPDVDSPLPGLPSFIHGRFHRDMMPKPITLHLKCSNPTAVRIAIARWARAGAVVKLSLDGSETTRLELPPAEADVHRRTELSVNVPAGEHSLEIDNAGDDWYVLSTITIEKYAPKLRAKGLVAKDLAVLWVRNSAPDTGDVSGTIAISGLENGRFVLWKFNTSDGTSVQLGTITAKNGSAEVPIRSLASDEVYVLRKAKT
jgi:hypothetical protein